MQKEVRSDCLFVGAGCVPYPFGDFQVWCSFLGSRNQVYPRLHQAHRRAAPRAGIQRNKVTVFSAHQMGSCQMGASAKSSVVAPDGQSWQVSGLYLADASVLPTSTGAFRATEFLYR